MTVTIRVRDKRDYSLARREEAERLADHLSHEDTDPPEERDTYRPPRLTLFFNFRSEERAARATYRLRKARFTVVYMPGKSKRRRPR